jgi:hypothetical protein
MRINRRHFLLGGAALAFGTSGSLWLMTRGSDSRTWIEAVVRKHLPAIDLDSESMSRFARSLAADTNFVSKRIELALKLDALAPAMVRLAPEVRDKIEHLERQVISEYLLGSNFFRVRDPRVQTIYFGAAQTACGNPFAVFRSD